MYRIISQFPRLPAPISPPARVSNRILKSYRPSHHVTHFHVPHSNISSKSSRLKSRYTLKSSTSPSLGALLIAITVLAVTYGEFIRPIEDNQSSDIALKDSKNVRNKEASAFMAGEVPSGRPDNLTAEEEQKLKELWLALQAVCGVSPLINGTDGASDATKSPAEAKEQDAEKHKKKKRLGLFSRSKEEDDKPNHTVMDGEDKYGQAKEYVKVLENQKPEELRDAVWSMVKHDNPDALLLRFLRARKWHVQNALIMMIATLHWRQQDQHVDEDIVYHGELGALDDSNSSDAEKKKAGGDFLMQMRLGKSFIHGKDKEGRPMCFVRVRLHHGSDQSEKSIERYTVFTIETARFLLKPPVDTAAIVFDMTDFSLANMDYTPVKFMIKVFEANYPESLGVVLVHKAPWIFHSIWKIIKGWLDPVVAAKIHFTKDLKDLEDFVPKKQIPKELGGDDPWEYSYVEPGADENLRLKDNDTKKKLLDERAKVIKEYEITTQQWVHDSKNQDTLKKRAELTEKLRKGYWELDPFVRARTMYDRTGLIQEGGNVDFYPEQHYRKPESETVPSATENGTVPVENTNHSPDDVD